MKLLGLSRDFTEDYVDKLISEFIEFREEKNLIKTIKFKAENIEANGTSGKILDKVVKVLIMG